MFVINWILTSAGVVPIHRWGNSGTQRLKNLPKFSGSRELGGWCRSCLCLRHLADDSFLGVLVRTVSEQGWTFSSAASWVWGCDVQSQSPGTKACLRLPLLDLRCSVWRRKSRTGQCELRASITLLRVCVLIQDYFIHWGIFCIPYYTHSM